MSVSEQTDKTMELDYKELFDALPDLYLVIAADAPRFTLIDADEAHMRRTGLKRSEFIGKPFFDVWPDTTEQFRKTGISEVKESLLTVIRTKKPHEMGVIRYDIPGPGGARGASYWKPAHYPQLDSDGNVVRIVQTNRDVTSEVEAEQKLKRTQEQLERALSAGLVGTWLMDIKTGKVIADRNLANMFGIDETEIVSELPLSTFLNSIHPEDRPQVEKEIEEAIATGEDYYAEYRTIGATGDLRWVITRGSIKRDTDGQPSEFSGVIVDITDRKTAEDATLQSQAQLKFMAESMPQKVFTALPQGEIDYFNPQWLQYTGLTEEQMSKEGWASIIHPDDLKRATLAWQKAVAEGAEFEEESRFRRYDGTYHWHLTRMRAMYDDKGAVTRWVGASTDISEQKQNEMNLRFLAGASKALASSLNYDTTLRKIADLAVPDIADWVAIDILDKEKSRVKQVAVAHRDPKKVEWAKEYRRKTPVDLDTLGGIAQVIRTGKSEFYPVITDEALAATTTDKKALKLARDLGLHSAMMVPIRMRNETVGVISFISAEQKRRFTRNDLDIAEELASRASLAMTNARLYKSAQEEIARREKLEEDLLMANDELESRVERRTRQLAETNESLERSNQELQDFAYVASHDLQEPLRKIQAFGNLLEEEYADQLGDGKDYLDRMRGAAVRMSVLIQDLLAFSRVTTKAKPLVPVDLNEIAAGVVDDLETRINETEGAVKLGKLPVIQADPLQMRQLLQNLIGNALKFHRPDVPPVIEVSATPVKSGKKIKAYELRISDNGIGFDEKYLDRIFAVFQRLHGKGAYEGTGIGLAVCRKIVERHGGTITASSTIGVGSTFIIMLPVKAGETKGGRKND